jgi:NADP-dependent aldehyde dehydrogenase
MTSSLGQLCTQPGLIFLLDTTDSRSLLDLLAALFVQTSTGNMLTVPIQSAYLRAIEHRGAAPEVQIYARSRSADGASAVLHVTNAEAFIRTTHLHEEIFGPTALAVLCRSVQDFERCAESLDGQLTATVWSDIDETVCQEELLWILEQKAGRIVVNGFPTGVELVNAMVHGGPFPATTDSRFTSVGTRSILRFVRPIAWQTPT